MVIKGGSLADRYDSSESNDFIFIQSRIVEKKHVKRYGAWGRTCFDITVVQL